MTQKLFERVLALCALSPLLGPGTVRRALRDVGADPATATVEDYCRAVPRLEVRLRSYLSAEEAFDRARAILALRSLPPEPAARPILMNIPIRAPRTPRKPPAEEGCRAERKTGDDRDDG